MGERGTIKKCTSTKYGTLVQIRAICDVYHSAFEIHVCGFPARSSGLDRCRLYVEHLDFLDIAVFALLGSLTPLLQSRRDGIGLIPAEYRVFELACY